MKVKNIHKRLIPQPITKVSQLFDTIATHRDTIWPKENWPAMRFKYGLKMGSKGGHGRIRYTIIAFEKGRHIKFKFTEPNGFIGTHELNITSSSVDSTEISHIIDMKTNCFKSTFLWLTTIRWLHDALIEEAFDNLENYFSNETKIPEYNLWVKLLRAIYKSKSFKMKHA